MARFLLRSFQCEVSCHAEIDTQSDFIAFVEDHIIKKLNNPITLAFDEVDRVLGRGYQHTFFSMLRLWHNRRAEPFSCWEAVDLALVIATEPYLLIDSAYRSPFNVTPPIEPRPFARPCLDELNAAYGELLAPTQLDDLYELLAGHPFLTRLAFYRLVAGRGMSFGELLDRAAEPDGPFGDHLRALLMLLQQHKRLLAAMRQAVLYGSISDDETFYRLHGAGLAKREGGRIGPANMLYARFFKGVQ
jgi:hypothetical protein